MVKVGYTASQLSRELCTHCGEITLHNGLLCVHCGSSRAYIKNSLEWYDDHTPKSWNLRRRMLKGQRAAARARRKHVKTRNRPTDTNQVVSVSQDGPEVVPQ